MTPFTLTTAGDWQVSIDGTRHWKPLRAALIAAVILAVYLLSLYLNFTEADRRAISLEVPPAGADYMIMDVSVVHVDLLRAEMTTRISFHLAGRLAQDAVTPATNLKLVLNTINGQQEYRFEKGQRINPIEAVFPLEGDVNLYPFDHYKGVMWMFVTLPGKPQNAPGPQQQAPINVVPDELARSADLPVSTTVLAQQIQADTKTRFSALIPGLTFRDSRSVQSAQTMRGLTGFQVDLRRSTRVIFISITTMLMMAGLSIGLVIVVLNVVAGSRNLTNFHIPMATSLIFGLPALRNIQPGVPPPGTFGDSIVFTWAEMAAAASAVALIANWLANSSRANKPPSN
jgi:hypothetical protein